MDRCSKFKMFNILIVLCVANFFLYRYFSDSDNSKIFSKSSDTRLTSHVTTYNIAPDGTAVDFKGLKTGDNSSRTDVTKNWNNTDASVFQGVDADVVKNSTASNVKTMTQHTSNSTKVNDESKPDCPQVPPNLVGALGTFNEGPSWEKIAKDNGLLPGGRYRPMDCKSRHRVAIVIPYRNREEHLRILLNNLHPMLIRQQLDYGIYVIDQELPTRFNRAVLMNIGYVEARKRYDYQCAVFHDVDLIPENDRNIYSCPEQPRHMSAAVDKFKYRLPYVGIFGGVGAINKEQFEKINGFSNLFFGWGGEDDDMSQRLRSSGFKITRYPMDIARYKMIKHLREKKNEANPKRHQLLKSVKKRMSSDGLNSLKYTVKLVEELPSHTMIHVFIDEKDYIK